MKLGSKIVSTLIISAMIFVLFTQMTAPAMGSVTFSISSVPLRPCEGERTIAWSKSTVQDYYWVAYVDGSDNIEVQRFFASNGIADGSPTTVVSAATWPHSGSCAIYTFTNTAGNIWYLLYFSASTSTEVDMLKFDATGLPSSWSHTSESAPFKVGLSYPWYQSTQKAGLSAVFVPAGSSPYVMQDTIYLAVLEQNTAGTSNYIEQIMYQSGGIVSNIQYQYTSSEIPSPQITWDGLVCDTIVYYDNGPVQVFQPLSGGSIYTSSENVYTGLSSGPSGILDAVSVSGLGFVAAYTSGPDLNILAYNGTNGIFSEFNDVHTGVNSILSLSPYSSGFNGAWGLFILTGDWSSGPGSIYMLDYAPRQIGGVAFSVTYLFSPTQTEPVRYISSVYSTANLMYNFVATCIVYLNTSGSLFGQIWSMPNALILNSTTITTFAVPVSMVNSYVTETSAGHTSTAVVTTTMTGQFFLSSGFYSSMIILMGLVFIPAGLLLIPLGIPGFMIGALFGSFLGAATHQLPYWIPVVYAVLMLVVIVMFKDTITTRSESSE